MKLKVFIGCMLVVAMLTVTSSVLALSLGVSPSEVELEVPGGGSATVDVNIHYFSGDVNISLIDIPLRVEPATIRVNASDEPEEVVLTIYGDNSLGSQVYNGYIRFIAVSGGAATGGVQVIAKVTNIVEGQPVPEESSEEILTEEASTGESEQSSPTPSESSSFPVLPVAGIAAGTIIIITLIIVFARRAMY